MPGRNALAHYRKSVNYGCNKFYDTDPSCECYDTSYLWHWHKIRVFLLASLMFSVQTGGLYYKSFTIVIYDCNDSTIVIYGHNDSGQYYRIMIIANAR